MNTNDLSYTITTEDYSRSFWNAMRGRNIGSISRGYDASTGMYALPAETSDRLAKAIEAESVLRPLATVIKAEGSGFKLEAKDCDDIAA